MSESEIQETGRSETWIPDYDSLMKMIVREGKPFKESALAIGYSPSVAASGLKRLLRDSIPAAEAYNREINRFGELTSLKPMAVRRLYAEIADYGSSLGMKAIELAGRFKETDWFVRNAEVNIGVFTALGEAGPAIDVVASTIPPEE
jgi:hypothetical protein